MSRYLIGIDLGTTNSALAYVDLSSTRAGKDGGIQHFSIPQLVGPGESGLRPLFPSFLYLPGAHDLPPGAAGLPWDPAASFIVGEFARNHGSRIPGRLVTSAKSWLCHAGVDRSAPLLPWSAPPDVARISPVEASRRFLQHLAQAWNHAMAGGEEQYRLEKQAVILTVPASFDDVARTLTVAAAHEAGLENVTLLEEPQAAFYCWLATQRTPSPKAGGQGRGERGEAAQLKPGDLCLVIDVGGGTTDFSLIQAVEQQGELGFVRQAVGDHLLLGGDNMDLALAKFVESRLPAAGRLDAAQYGMLTQACRQAKEILLGPNPPAAHTVTVMGRGRQVVGGSLHTSLTTDDVHRCILDGFFPLVPGDAQPQRGARTGLHEMGLPYVNDPAITRHLAAFLSAERGRRGEREEWSAQGEAQRAGDAEERTSTLGPGRSAPGARLSAPLRAVLFNGGVFQPALLRERVMQVLHQWFDRSEATWQPLVLTNPSLDLAVALGAAHFAWLRHTGGKRIGGGIARSYYIAVAQAEGSVEREAPSAESRKEDHPADAPGAPRSPLSAPRSTPGPPRSTLVCVVPQHLEEGKEISLGQPELELALGQPVAFPLFTSTVREGDKAGDLLQVSPGQLLQLPPLHTILRGGKRSGTKSVPVTLAARCTEIGTLELWCVAREGTNRWRLEFNLRDIVKEVDEEAGSASGEKQLADVWPEEQIQKGARLIRSVFSGDRSQESGVGSQETVAVVPRQLTKALESALESGRDRWPTGLCRRLWEYLAEVADQRRSSPDHLSRWYNLVGFCLRPGFGDSLDRFRVEQLWKLLQTPPRQAPGSKPAPKILEGGADYWIMWRRVAGGLNLQHQSTLFNRLRSVLIPAKGKAVSKPPANEYVEMWRTAASLERLDLKHKELLGQTVLKMCRRSPAPAFGFFTLTRLGARVLLYGPLNAVLHPERIQTWLDALFAFEPGNPSERLAWAFCLTQLARKSGQRALDIDDSRRQTVLTILRSQKVPAHWMHMVEEVLELEEDEQQQMFGESLPIGLRLVKVGSDNF